MCSLGGAGMAAVEQMVPEGSPDRLSQPRVLQAPAVNVPETEFDEHCGWFVYFTDDGNIARIVQYDDIKLVECKLCSRHPRFCRILPERRSHRPRSR